MKPARIRELKVFGILFLTFFLGTMLTFGAIDYALRPLLSWISHGTLIFPSIEIKKVLRIGGYAAGGGFVAAAILFLEGKHSGRW